MATKSGGKTIFAKSHQQTLQTPWGSKISAKSLYRIFVFNTEIQDGRQKWWENVFLGEIMPVDSEDTLWIKNFVEIVLSRSVSEINTFLHFTQKFKMAAKSGGKMIFGKNRQ